MPELLLLNALLATALIGAAADRRPSTERAEAPPLVADGDSGEGRQHPHRLARERRTRRPLTAG